MIYWTKSRRQMQRKGQGLKKEKISSSKAILVTRIESNHELTGHKRL